jgi:hypothetical protein
MADDRDLRSGTFDPAIERSGRQAHPARAKTTPHQADQHGAAVRSEPEEQQDESPLPEGLRRQTKGPYSPARGRAAGNE